MLRVAAGFGGFQVSEVCHSQNAPLRAMAGHSLLHRGCGARFAVQGADRVGRALGRASRPTMRTGGRPRYDTYSAGAATAAGRGSARNRSRRSPRRRTRGLPKYRCIPRPQRSRRHTPQRRVTRQRSAIGRTGHGLPAGHSAGPGRRSQDPPPISDRPRSISSPRPPNAPRSRAAPPGARASARRPTKSTKKVLRQSGCSLPGKAALALSMK